MVGGTYRPGLAAVDKDTGALLPFDAHIIAPWDWVRVNHIAVGGDYVYFSGHPYAEAYPQSNGYLEVGGQSRYALACVDAYTGDPQPWAPKPNSTSISGLIAHNTTVYVCGHFGNIGGQTHQALAAIENAGGGAASFMQSLAAQAGGIGIFIHV